MTYIPKAFEPSHTIPKNFNRLVDLDIRTELDYSLLSNLLPSLKFSSVTKCPDIVLD